MLYTLELRKPDMLVCQVNPRRLNRDGQVEPFSGSLKALLMSPQRKVSAPDRQLLMRLLMLQPLNSAFLALRGKQGMIMVRDLIATGRCFWVSAKLRLLTWGPDRAAAAGWKLDKEGLAVPVMNITPPAARVLPLIPPLYVDETGGHCGILKTNLPDELAAGWLAQAPLSPEASVVFGATINQRFPGIAVPLPGNLAVQRVEGVVPVPCLRISVLAHRLEQPMPADQPASPETGRQPTPRPGTTPISITLPIARLVFDYQGHSIHHDSPNPVVVDSSTNVLRHIVRDGAAEKSALRRLADYGLQSLREMFSQHQVAGHNAQALTLPEDSALDWGQLLREVFPALQQEGWRIAYAANCRLAAADDKAWYTDLKPSGRNWFEFEAGIESNGQRINLLPVVHQLLRQTSPGSPADWEALCRRRTVAIPMADGTLVVISGQRLGLILRNLFELFERDPLQANRRLKISGWRAAELTALEQCAVKPWKIPPSIRRLAERLAQGVTFNPREQPPGLRGALRDYQRVGLDWLQFLREYEAGGILADDMGLGKTLEALALLLAEKQAGRLARPALIVMPTSVLISWLDAIPRFTPGLSTLVLHGADRKRQFAAIDRHDLVLTTYPLLRRDYAVLRERTFSYLILDEAQCIKNPGAQVAQCVCRLQADRRLCLTGTPIENHLGELWSLFHFLMPGFLGDLRSFNELFRKPIEKEQDPTRRAWLARRTAPFILRRTKQAVARELPPKTEIVMEMELSERQRDLYETVRVAVRSRVQQTIAEQGLNRSHIMILDALLKLRQVCCDPRLLDKKRRFRIPNDSCKLEALVELLPEQIEEGRRILLFSQFVSMLTLIEKICRRLKIPYALLTGSTKDRAGQVAAFQGGAVPLFLISLKAGGFGLNLTAADTVIHYDPWWNPAVENQATDRAHRIGQTKSVFIYKLITRGTVETKILDMQKQKQALVRGILDEQAAGKVSFSADDIDKLFAPIG